jgi:hypothetical protein
MTKAIGVFDVTIVPLALHAAGDPLLGRMSIDKVFYGALAATSQGEMLSAGTAVKGSAVYVAIERITGTLNGRRGSFVVHHLGVMTRGEGVLTVTIAPDSGTDELTGITGKIAITIVDGKHLYDVDYQLPDA